jgi:cytochrome c553
MSVSSLLRRLGLCAGLLAAALPTWAQDMAATHDVARRALHVCAACHGEGGRSSNPAYPNLAGQPAQYTVQQLRDFRAQQRAESDAKAYMWGVSALLDDAAIQALADHYAVQAPASGHGKASAATLALGRKLFTEGAPARGVKACASCHGDKAEGTAGFPRLAGQHAEYLVRQLKGFSTRLRPHGVLMKNETAGMSSNEIKAVAAYLQSL